MYVVSFEPSYLFVFADNSMNFFLSSSDSMELVPFLIPIEMALMSNGAGIVVEDGKEVEEDDAADVIGFRIEEEGEI